MAPRRVGVARGNPWPLEVLQCFSWACTAAAPCCHPLRDISAGPTTWSLKANWHPPEKLVQVPPPQGQWPLGLCKLGPYSQDPGLQPLLSRVRAGTSWSPGAPRPICLHAQLRSQ